jgi:hypothetical protein
MTEHDWRTALDDLASAMRELEVRRAENDALRGESAGWRQRATAAEAELAVHAARYRLKEYHRTGRLDPALTGTEMMFGQTETDAVRVPDGQGNAEFLVAMAETLLKNDRPVYFKVERKRPVPVAAMPTQAEREAKP